MFRARWLLSALMIGLVLAPPAARARAMGVDIWTDRGKDAVYEPGEPVQIKVRASDDAYLLVYDIDSEGYVRVLYPYEGSSGYVAGRHTYQVPPTESGLQLVVQEPVGEGYVVAVVSREPFSALPWYLRPYDPQAEGVGYVGEEDEEEGVTSEGRITGDPFVAMERVRRRVLSDPHDREGFATAYTSYYVHQPVRYPRYLCDDCHRPRYWAWWDGWDPYYTTCRAFDFRVYWGWAWGPSYWFGSVPYFCFVPRCYPCDPYDRPWYSSWSGPRTWDGLWSGHLVRHKSPPPVGYTPPDKRGGRTWGEGKPLPPGYLPADFVRDRSGIRTHIPIGASRPSGDETGRPGMRPRPDVGTRPGTPAKPGVTRGPAVRPRTDDGGGTRYVRPQREVKPMPRTPAGDESAPAPRPAGRPREVPRPAAPPRYERPSESPRPSAPPRQEPRPAAPPRYERPSEAPRPSAPSAPPPKAPEQRPAPSSGSSEKSDSGGGRRWR